MLWNTLITIKIMTATFKMIVASILIRFTQIISLRIMAFIVIRILLMLKIKIMIPVVKLYKTMLVKF
ncbi:expressed protein [Phakopsora pachyrhizi]|uniref:Expressed protein n=1 Tax=Phakopsora pachyrhizi TaxID=170000 RepID=A0AAV0ASI8_PHAPC|nr:expressed protein [Phakopsora pachyrhizi]